MAGGRQVIKTLEQEVQESALHSTDKGTILQGLNTIMVFQSNDLVLSIRDENKKVNGSRRRRINRGDGFQNRCELMIAQQGDVSEIQSKSSENKGTKCTQLTHQANRERIGLPDFVLEEGVTLQLFHMESVQGTEKHEDLKH